jgi:hypothetical protein
LHKPSLLPDICHPILDDVPCPILQYADDTLIFLRASPMLSLLSKTPLTTLSLLPGYPSITTKLLSSLLEFRKILLYSSLLYLGPPFHLFRKLTSVSLSPLISCPLLIANLSLPPVIGISRGGVHPS